MIRAPLVLLAACFAFAQAPATPAFEVASVKPDKTGANQGPGRGREYTKASPGSLIMQNIRLSSAMVWAYDVKRYQVSGPAWLNFERYDITAKAAGPVPDADLKLMLRTLLAERFGLAFHRETKELPVYVLLVGKGGPKFQESEGTGETTMTPGGRGHFVMDVQRASIAQAVDMMSGPLQRPVLDMTGLTGRYDFKFDLTPYLGDLEPGAGVTRPVGVSDVESILISALQDQLGLRLEARKAPIDMLVIDHAERVPTEN
jgi:uncharacterized protein (TIGR03435 family)